MKKFFWCFSLIGVVFFSCYASRHFILGKGLELALRKMTGETIDYHHRSWENGKIIYQGFFLGEQLYAENASFDFDFHLFPFSLNTKVHLLYPKIQLDDADSDPVNLAFLLPGKFWNVKLDINNGSLTSPDGKIYNFDLVSGPTKEEIGKISVYQDELLFTCGFDYLAGSLAVDFQMEEAAVAKMVPLASLFYPLQAWNVLEGTASAAVKGTLDLESLTFLQGHFSLQNVRWESETVIFAVDKTHSQIDFQGDMETFVLDTDFKGVDLFWKDLEVLRGEGSIVFKPQEMPTFEAHAALHLGTLEGRADLVGQGEIHHKDSLWLEGTFDYVTANNPLKIDFSWADDGTSQVLQTQIHNLGKEILTLLPFVKIQQGRLDGQITTFLDQWIFQRMQLDKVQIHELALDRLTVQEIEAKGSVNLLSNDIEYLALQAHEAAGEYQGLKVSSANATFSIKDNIFESSSAFGKLNNIPFALQLQGPISSFHASAKLAGGASEWLQLPKKGQENHVALELAIDRKQEELNVTGTLSCLDDIVQLKAHGNLSTALWQGNFHTPRIQSSFYTPFLHALAPHINVQGNLALHGQFSQESIDTFVQGQDLVVSAPNFQVSVPGQSRELLYHYDLVQKQGRGSVKLSPLFLASSQFPSKVSITGGDLAFDQTSLTCKDLAGQISGIDVQGNLAAHWENLFEASFISQKIQGSVENLLAATSHLYQFPFPMEGRFVSPPEGVQVRFAEGKYHYRLQGFFQELQGVLTPKLYLHNTSCSVVFDSLDHHLSLQNLQGKLNENISLVSQHVGFKNGQWNFDAAFAHDSQPVLSLQGQAHETTQGYNVILHEGKAAESYLKEPLSFHWTHQGKIDQMRGVIHLEADSLVPQLALLDQCGLFELTPSLKETLEQLQGSMTLRLSHDSDRSEYELQGSQIRYASSLFNSVDALLLNQGAEWILKRCALDEVQMKGRAVYQNGKWIVPTWDVDWKDLRLQTAGVYEKDKFDFEMNGQLKSFALKGSGLFISSTPHFRNIALKVYDQSSPIADLSCDKLSYQEGKWGSPALNTTIFSSHFAHPLRAKLLLSLSSKSITFQGAASEGDLPIGKSSLKITQVFGFYEAPYLNLKCIAALDDEPLQFIGKFSSQLAGAVHVQHGKELLKISLSNPTTFQKAEGELFGVGVSLTRENQGYQGTVSLKDGTKLADLADNETLRDLSGLQLKGYFEKNIFKGELDGKDACLKDYFVQELHANVEYSPTQFRLKNMTVQDPAGSFSMKECLGTRLQDDWNITVPILKGQEIKPSVLRKKGVPQKEIKPLQIRHLVMTNISGNLSDLKSFRGLGTFNFTQRVKKEPSVFDIPLTMLKDLGLDLELFTPVIGEVKLQLKDGKIFVTDLQNAFSEGNRSEFYLAPIPSFIDLNGNLSLNLRMQQNVVLKLVEPFMIAVRGTWEKPKYSLQ